jgi:hypothetical protein
MSRIGIKWMKTIGCEVTEKKTLLYSPDVRYMSCTFFPSMEVSKNLPIAEEYKDHGFLFTYINSAKVGDEYSFALNRFENGIGV